MRKVKFLDLIALCVLLFAACNTGHSGSEADPKTDTIVFAPTEEIFANPERGLLIQTYYTSGNLNAVANANTIELQRKSASKVTVYLHSYYLTDYMDKDIPQEFLDRLDKNMDALRKGGAKVVLRVSYKSNESESSKPWDATPQWVHRHIDQIAPYLQKHADVILCMQAGFVGVWGEWYYTSNFNFQPQTDADYEPRWEVLEHLLRVLPEDRQLAVRTPDFKMRYLKSRNLGVTPLTAEEAYQPTAKARICGHNDCFVASADDYGTYLGQEDRKFWQEDTKYTMMGGETCQECAYSGGINALKQLELYHWTYLHRDYNTDVLDSWREDGVWEDVMRRLGYRLALDKAVLNKTAKAGKNFEADFWLHNSGFAAPVNKRGLELVFVSVDDPSKKFVYPQTEDPRFWLPGEHTFTLACTLDKAMAGEYNLYINLPDAYDSLHDNPAFSIRLANDDIWDEATGYNFVTTVTVE